MFNPISKNGLLLAGFAVVATLLIVVTDQITRPAIKYQQAKQVLSVINQIMPPESYNNDLVSDCTLIPNPFNSKDTLRVYRARLNESPSGLIIESIAPNGYNGKITMLVGVDMDQTITGVRVIEHKETPGLGDKIDKRISDWIDSFKNTSLSRPDENLWKVKKDGGQFDQFTGATITPRAVVQAVANTLMFFDQHNDSLFNAANSCQTQN